MAVFVYLLKLWKKVLTKKVLEFSISKETHWYTVLVNGIEFSSYNFHRHDTDLISVIEEMGDATNSADSKLKVVELDSDYYQITSYDGHESVLELYTNSWTSVKEQGFKQ